MNSVAMSDFIPDDVLADAVAPGCSVPGIGARPAMMAATALEQFADELQVLMATIDGQIGTLELDVMHRIAERARAVSTIVSIMHRRELADASTRDGGTFRAAEPCMAAEE
jgi:hypothetical protein